LALVRVLLFLCPLLDAPLPCQGPCLPSCIALAVSTPWLVFVGQAPGAEMWSGLSGCAMEPPLRLEGASRPFALNVPLSGVGPVELERSTGLKRALSEVGTQLRQETGKAVPCSGHEARAAGQTGPGVPHVGECCLMSPS